MDLVYVLFAILLAPGVVGHVAEIYNENGNIVLRPDGLNNSVFINETDVMALLRDLVERVHVLESTPCQCGGVTNTVSGGWTRMTSHLGLVNGNASAPSFFDVSLVVPNNATSMQISLSYEQPRTVASVGYIFVRSEHDIGYSRVMSVKTVSSGGGNSDSVVVDMSYGGIFAYYAPDVGSPAALTADVSVVVIGYQT